MCEKKIVKYIGKLYHSTESGKIPLYLDKIADYSFQKNQKGGVIASSPLLYDQIVSIIRNNYVNATNAIKKSVMSKCMESRELFSPITKVEDDIMCFRPPNNDTLELSDLIYQFKKSFRTLATDIFNGSVLNSEDVHLMTNYIYFTLNYAIECYKDLAISYDVFGRNAKIRDNIKLLYKGGNTVRCLIGCFLNTLKDKGMDPTKHKEYGNILKTYNELKIGDWDYSVYINYPKFSKESHEKLRNQLLQVVHVALVHIADRINLFLHSHDIQHEFATKMKEAMFSETMTQDIKEFVEKYNSAIPENYRKISNIDVRSVTSCGYIVTKDQITSADTTDELKKLSLMATDYVDITPRTSASTATANPEKNLARIVLRTAIPYIDSTQKVVLAYPIPNIISNLYVALTLQMCKSRSVFDLIRQKISALTTFNVTYADEPNAPLVRSIYSLIEIIDVSIDHQNSENVNTMPLYVPNHEKHKETVVVSVKKEYSSNYYDMQCSIPSEPYMFGNLAKMLFLENMFIWDNKKYYKRLTRLNILALICCYVYEEMESAAIRDHFKNMIELYTELNGIVSLDEKLTRLSKIYSVSQEGTLSIADIKCNVPYYNNILIKYIKILILSKFILRHEYKDEAHYKLCVSELGVSYILEFGGIDKSVTALTLPLKKLYKIVTGLEPTFTGEPTLNDPNKHMKQIKRHDTPPDKINEHLEKIKMLEADIIKSFIELNLLVADIGKAGITNITEITYKSDSLY